MKKTLSILITVLMLTVLLAVPASANINVEPRQEVVDYPFASMRIEELGVGTMEIYDFGGIKLHAYNTNDPLADVCYLLETDTELIGIEAPALHVNLNEYITYIGRLNKPLTHILLPNHPTGASSTLYDGISTYALPTTQAAMQDGGSIKGLTDGFVEAFGSAFDGRIAEITNVIEPGAISLGGVQFIITENGENFDIEIPAINCVYTHMMGSNAHNILASTQHINGFISQLEGYQAKRHNLILTGHHMPEPIEMVAVKINYLNNMKVYAAQSEGSAQFIREVMELYPDYDGVNYLEMSAGFLFAE